METKTAYDLLMEYPKKRGYDYHTTKDYTRFYLFPSDPSLNTKFVIFEVKPGMWFYAYDSFATRAYMSKTTTGLYTTLNMVDEKMSMRVYKKDWSDIIFRSRKRKTGDSEVGSKLTITSKKRDFPKFLITWKTAEILLKLNEIAGPVWVALEYDYKPNIQSLHQKMVAGVETSDWLYEEKQVDEFIKESAKLLEQFKTH